jgi:hypothetical protein
MMAVGPTELLNEFLEELQGVISLKIVGKIDDQSWTKFLGKEYKREGRGFLMRIPQSYLQSIFEAAGLSSGKAAKTPGTNSRTVVDTTPLGPKDFSRFRTILGKVQWIALDRPDLAFACKEIAREMAHPTVSTWLALKRLVRYLRTNRVQELHPHLAWGSDVRFLDVYTDSNWAPEGDRKSTSCGFLCVGKFPLQFYSRTQSVIALSSGEAELLSLTMGAQEGKGLQALLAELGLKLQLRCHSDSTAALGTAGRRGLGRVKHLELRTLWIQSEVSQKKLLLQKISTGLNPADLGTKHLPSASFENCVSMVGLRTEGDDGPNSDHNAHSARQCQQ